MSRMYKSQNLLHFFSWEESLGAEMPAVEELPIFISLELLLGEQWFREITLSNQDFSHHFVYAKKSYKCLSK